MSDPRGANLWPKFEILTVLGAVFPHFCPKKREICHVARGADSRPLVRFPCQISVCWSNVLPLHPVFGPLSKNNTGMAVLHAGLPVIKTTLSATN